MKTTKTNSWIALGIWVLIGLLGGCKGRAGSSQAESPAPPDPLAAEFYRRCREAVAKELHYARPVEGDEHAILDRGYRSFLLHGADGDLFSCEVAPDRTYTLKMAPKGVRPFRDGSSGKF
jgi:hypothetical protein